MAKHELLCVVALLVSHAEQVGVEVVEVCRLVATPIASPGVGLGVESLVQEVQGLVWIDYVAVGADKLCCWRGGQL